MTTKIDEAITPQDVRSVWNYRVIEFIDPNNGPWRAIHEVHYGDDGNPVCYSENPAAAVSEVSDTDGGLAWILDRMRDALDKPVLSDVDFLIRPMP